MAGAAEAAAGVPADHEALEDALDAICVSAAFRNSPQQQRFLRHLVGCVQQGNLSALREMSLGVELFRRPAGQFDPKKDPIVRVEARRLRDRLARYYLSDGAHDTVEIVVPLGSYVPVIRQRHRASDATVVPAEVTALNQRAWYLMRIRSIEGYRMALGLFTRAAERCEASADAHRGSAWARICIAGHEGVPPEAGEQREAVRSAIERAGLLEPLAPSLSLLQGAFAARFEHDFVASEQTYHAGRTPLGSNEAFRTSLGWLYTLTGRFDEARRVFEDAQARDPFGFWHRHNLASLAYFRRDYALAARLVAEALEVEPDHAQVRLLRARLLTRCGAGEEAVAEAQWCTDALPGMTGPPLYRVAALAAAGRLDTARSAMAEFSRAHAGSYTSPVYRAMALTALGEHEPALDALRAAAAARDYWLPNVAIDPAFDALRGCKGFDALQVALPPVGARHSKAE